MNRTDEANRERLARAMDLRRIELRRTWEQIAKEAGTSTTHLRKFRTGENNLSPVTQAGVEAALGWQVGAFDRIVADEDPLPLDSEPTAPRVVTGSASAPLAFEAKATAQVQQNDAGRSRAELQQELDFLLSHMTPEEREQWEKDVAAEESRLEQIRLRRRLEWARLMSGELPPAD